MMNILCQLGWSDDFQRSFTALAKPDLIPARIISQQKNYFRLQTGMVELEGVISGKLSHNDQIAASIAVGDWVAVLPPVQGNIALIEAVLPRRSQFTRLAAGGNGRRSGGVTAQQVIAANIDLIFIVSALDQGRGLNLRRLERYLTLSWNSGASPILILNKTDLCQDLQDITIAVETIAQGVPILPVSALHKEGLDLIRSQIGSGITAAFIGPSGVGKSSIINALSGTEVMRVDSIRQSDSTGHHTTTHRELFLLPQGGAVIDTPGMREIQLWSDQDSLDVTFADIQMVAAQCRFADCSHDSEPGCAVRQAIASGEISVDRFNNYLKMQKELRYLEARQNGRVRIEEKARWRQISQLQKQISKNRQSLRD
jgi:ribosome biogenesis GTPase / thiamine phosphate phosphatase